MGRVSVSSPSSGESMCVRVPIVSNNAVRCLFYTVRTLYSLILACVTVVVCFACHRYVLDPVTRELLHSVDGHRLTDKLVADVVSTVPHA